MKRTITIAISVLMLTSLLAACDSVDDAKEKLEGVFSGNKQPASQYGDMNETNPFGEIGAGNISEDFKAAMDSYENFMDEYIAFMKKYQANPTDMNLLTEYADYMKEYAEFVEDFEQWEDEEMNDAELAYYLDVQTRVSKKLLEVANG